MLFRSVGTLAARWVVVEVMRLPFAFAPGRIGLVVLATLAATTLFGLLATWRALAARPVDVLRAT